MRLTLPTAPNWRVTSLVVFGVAVLLLSRPSRPAGQSIGLVAAYGLNEGTGTTIADLSGHNITGTIVGATWTTGRYGSALSFNGTSSYVDLGNPAALQLTSSMTVEAWVKAAANPADDGQIVAKSNGTGWQLKTTPDTGPHTFGFTLSPTSSTTTQRYSTTARALATWYHVTGVYDAAARTLSTYVNGVLDNGTLNGTVPASQFNQTVNVNIGRRTGGFYFNGVIDEVRIYNRALSQADVQSDMNTPVGGAPPPPDNIPPTVSISSPADGATVSGTVSVSATAADNVGVAGVQFYLDSIALGSEVVAAPFTYQWNTSTTPIGTHTLSAIARDFGGNTAGSSVITVNVTNPSAAVTGQWSAVANWPIVAVHAMLLPTGNVLAWTDYTENAGAQLWRPSTNTFVPKTFSLVSLFCSGHAFMPDGRLMITGGIVGLQDDLGPHETTIFDPATETWSQAGLMTLGRYYPTATTLGDGRVMVQGGTTTCTSCIANTPEIYDPTTNVWTPMAASANKSFMYYPHIYQLPDGRILAAAQDDRAIATQVLDLTTQTWSTVDSKTIDGHSSAMYLPGKIIKAGTATADNPGHPSAATTYILDMTRTSPAPAWQATASMAFRRSFLNLTVLPDGQVLATGGGTTTDPADFSKAVYEAELWSPTTTAWTTMARAQIPRLYHSTALLLPDARVLVAGGGRQNGRSQPDPADQPNAEIFSPPYLFKGPRPVITSAPAVLQYSSPFAVATPDGSRIASVSLIALGAVTHAFNENQRFVPLTFTPAGGGLTVNGPINGNTAPPGPYMLFLVDTNGVPSVAAMVRLPAPNEDLQPPGAPANLQTSSATGVISLNWSASTDNVGVTAYNVHRSTTSGFTPTAGNKIGQAPATSYADTAFSTAGTYYYLVTAQDAKGNISAPSNQASGTASLDTTAPTVSVTAPSPGATVSGIRTVTASASDDVAVAGVQFLLDGLPLGAEVPGPGVTFNLSWTTSTTSNGPHTLSARARDGAGNTTLAANVGVTVSNVTPSGLVAAYSFNESSGTTVTDYSGNNLTGTIVGATRTTGRYGNGLSFNGTTNYVDLGNPAAFQLTGSMTIEAWVKAAANPADDGQIVAKSNGNGWQLKTSPDTGPHTFAAGVSPNTSSNTQRYSTTARALGTWYHVAGVYNAASTTLSTYVNGVLDNGTLRGTVPASQVNSSVNVNIGRRTGGFYFNGVIDEVRIYNRALTQAEIQTDLNTPINLPAPTLTSLSPASGSTAGGTAVLLAGTNLVSGATVTIGGAAATGVNVISGTSIAATTPAHAAGAVTVTVTNPDGQTGSLATAFTYSPSGPAPTVGSASPGSGPTAGGTAITIDGTNFVSGATVTIGGAAATSVIVGGSTSITATTPAHAAGAVAISVTNPDTQTGSLPSAFTYLAPPGVTGVSPAAGPTGGSTPVTITGTNFVNGASVTFGGVAATSVSVLSGSSITAATPAHASGAVLVTVVNPDTQSGSLASGYTYLAPAPTVLGVSPGSVPAAGGSTMTITGDHFVSGATVTVGGTPATSIVVVNVNTITATTPAHAAGAVTVTVTNPDTQSGSLASGLTYVAPPSVIGVSPSAGPTAGGTVITVSGTGFVAGTTVTVGGAAATGVTIVTSNSMTAVTPAHAAGAAGIVVTNPDGQTGSLASSFMFVAPPGVTGVSPSAGPTTGGTTITITGTSFASGASVTVGGIPATGIAVINAGSITANTPAHAEGVVTVVVTNPDAQIGSLAAAFTYNAPAPAPTVEAFSPDSGPTSGGTPITVTGSHFVAGASVTVGGTPAIGVTIVSDTSITAISPPHPAGIVVVAVTNPDGQAGSLAGAFTYIASPAPSVASISPSAGPTAGGTAVTITGDHFVSGATVTIGGTAATGVTVTGTSITATTPAHVAGAVAVSVTNPDAQQGILAGAFTYVAPPAITGVSPASGSTAGGTIVTIAGTGFISGATVNIGGVWATGVTVVNANTITATTPVHGPGTIGVTVTNPDAQSASLAGSFTYVAPAPSVLSVVPGSGPTAGGTSVTITGSAFVSGASVRVGGTLAAGVSVVNANSIVATAPAHVAGAVLVTVTNPDGQGGSLTNGFTYVAPAPSVQSVSPAIGPTAGGTSATITGSGFVSGASVTVGGAPATNVSVVNATSITMKTPAHAAGAVMVTVTNPDMQAGSLDNAFTFAAASPPTVSAILPPAGTTAGGALVTISGTNFVTGATVTIGGVPATGVTFVSAASLTAVAPAHAAGTVTVTVTNPDGQSGSLTNAFTYVAPGAISFVRVSAATPSAAATSVAVAYSGSQTAGDLNIVVVGWNTTSATVQSVRDSAGNQYSLAIGPTIGTGRAQAIYFAPNIVAGSNTVTVTFTASVSAIDVRALEYRGVSTLDIARGAIGTSGTANSGAGTTTTANELIVGANTVANWTTGAGSGFTSRIITSPNGDIAEDRIVAATGSYSATAPVAGTGAWVMQMVTFK